jgi:hypothetical protein
LCRDKTDFTLQKNLKRILVEVDFLEEETLPAIPIDIDAAYLIHSMSSSSEIMMN